MLVALVLVTLVQATLVLLAGWTDATSTSANFIKAPVILTVVRVPCPKISTGLEKISTNRLVRLARFCNSGIS